LRRVIGKRLGRAHSRVGTIAIAARPEIAADDDGRARRFVLLADACELRDRLALHARERLGIVAELRRPIGVRAPGRALEHYAGAVRAADLRIACEIALENRLPLGAVEQHERREERQIDAFVIDQRRLEAAVGNEWGVPELGELPPVLAHDALLFVGRSAGARGSGSRGGCSH